MDEDTTRPLRLLAVEDDPTDRSWLELMLKDATVWPYTMRFVGTMADAEAAVTAGNYDCVLLDLSLPDCEGLESVRRVHAAKATVPIVVLTGRKDQEIGLGAIEAGAQDYLVKGQASGNTILQAARWASARLTLRGATGGPSVIDADRVSARSGDGAEPLAGAAPHVQEAWVALAVDLTLTHTNAAFLELVGAHEAEVIGLRITDFLAPDDVATTLPALHRLISGVGGISASRSVRLRHRLGHWLDRTLVATPLGEPAPEEPNEALFVLLAAPIP